MLSASRPGDWMCPSCYNNNFASRHSCFRCSAPKPGQPVHPDGKHLFEEGDHLPPHCITVFVPLIDMSGDLGPTEFYPATHRRDCPPQDYKACETGDCEGVAFTSAKAGDAATGSPKKEMRRRRNSHSEKVQDIAAQAAK